MSFATAHIHDNLAEQFPLREKDWPYTIGLLHCSVGRARARTLRSMQYPGSQAMRLRPLGTYIHQPTVIDDQDSRIVYAGNPQGRDMGESGERGCQLVTVGADGAVEVETVRTSRYLWKEIEIDVSGSVDLGALEEEIRKELAIISEEEEVPVVGRIILTGATRLHRELVAAGGLVALEERLIEDPPASQYPIYPEQIICQTVPVIDRDAILCRDDILGEICRQSDLAISNESGRNRLREETSSLYQYARAYTSKPDDEEFDAIIREAEALLLSQLSEGGGE